jgi:hypothetical protein
MFGGHLFACSQVRKFAAVVAALSVVASATAEPVQGPGYETSGDTIVFTVDVAENFDLFETAYVRLTSRPSDVEPLFVTRGTVFPQGTIKGDGSDFDPNAPGALGQWLCRGARTTPARLFPPNGDFKVQISQIYLFPDETRAIATEGSDHELNAGRTITHATGMYRGFSGEQRQEFLGYNATGGVNLRVTFVLTKQE